jgi:hypothetical protein
VAVGLFGIRETLDFQLVPTTLPASAGGAGLGWTTALLVVREIATADGSIAQLLGYHYVNVANLWWVNNASGLTRWGPPSAAEQWRWGDAVNPTDPDLVLVPDGAGSRLACPAGAPPSSRERWTAAASRCSWSCAAGRRA